MKKCELLAPGGSFTSAYYALRNGADAVYSGLTEFSARKYARNPDMDQLRRLKMYAVENGKKIYIAINTVIKEQESRLITNLLADVSLIQPDALIIQDMGLLNLLRSSFPFIRLHASTQMAVHSAAGLEYLREAGIKRVVLARELTSRQIRKLREAVPDMELEVFIHGALCYSFSGLCLASGILLGRSGNRGECAQPCRSWYQSGEEKGYYFSCNDLALKEEVLKLKEIGVDSLKIEGRMKSPEYTAYTAAYYRALLDGRGDPGNLFKDSKTAFARKQIPGFFSSGKGRDLINKLYPSHKGTIAGKVLDVRNEKFLLQLTDSLALHDGLLFFKPGRPPEAVKFGVHKMFLNKMKIIRGKPGDMVWIITDDLPAKGDEVFKISSQDTALKEINPSRFSPWKYPVTADVVLTAKGLTLTAEPLPWSTAILSCSMEIIPGKAEKEAVFKEILEQQLSKSDTSLFSVAAINFSNESRLPENRIFIRPSRLKDFRKKVYSELAAFYSREKQAVRFAETLSLPADGQKQSNPPLRSLWLYHGENLPFISGFSSLSLEDLPVYDGRYVLCLLPVIINREDYRGELISFLAQYPGESFLIGLGNTAHLQWTGILIGAGDVRFFVDYPLYCANLWAYLYYLKMIPDLDFIFYWIEGSETDYRFLLDKVSYRFVPLVKIDQAFSPHLFISRVCYKKYSSGGHCKGCRKEGTFTITQNRKTYRIVVKDCLTFMFRDSGGNTPGTDKIS